MQIRLLKAAAALSFFGLISCVESGPAPTLGDMGAGGDPAEGGIIEVPNPSAAMAKKSGKPLTELQRGHEVYICLLYTSDAADE